MTSEEEKKAKALHETALQLSERIKAIRAEDDKVVRFDPARPHRPSREPPLSDAELAELRRMLSDFASLREQFERITAHGTGCPVAAHILSDR